VVGAETFEDQKRLQLVGVWAEAEREHPLVCAQVVLISSGLNDWKSTPPEYSMDDWLAQALAFLKQVCCLPPYCRIVARRMH